MEEDFPDALTFLESLKAEYSDVEFALSTHQLKSLDVDIKLENSINYWYLFSWGRILPDLVLADYICMYVYGAQLLHRP